MFSFTIVAEGQPRPVYGEGTCLRYDRRSVASIVLRACPP
jgi:hypothetical protein